MNKFKPGQKWISSTEPELGIGRIIEAAHRLVTIKFDLVEEVRNYAHQQAPLARVRFNPGDTIRTTDGVEMIVKQVLEKDGILVYQGKYQGASAAIIETDLDPGVIFSKPEERLLTQQFDDNHWFNLRYETLQHRARLAASPARGLIGPRVTLIPHQFYIAREIASRYAPRVLLADEVGLGKTIEAGLILHQQLVTGRASRVLVITPPALRFQWFVEMIRRFNLRFTLLDEERLAQIEADNRPGSTGDDPGIANPFDAQQLMLCSLDIFLDNESRFAQAMAADWDLVIVDEAHHLHWEAGRASDEYHLVEQLGGVSKGLLLLTATPEQLGRLGHFSRLRLLDPSRYHDYDSFLAEEKAYEEVARLLAGANGETLRLDDGNREQVRARLGKHAPDSDDDLAQALLDRHGVGRVLFRNVRESVAGFPRRKLVHHELDPEHFPLVDSSVWCGADARLGWLTDMIANSTEKFLVICSRAETAIALERHLRDRTSLRSAAFHENLDLVARDRAANFFADKKKGAQVLVCSEIGSEGRNFQFAHHLVMYDLPPDPELLEQRIGRLDRIGQQQDISIHVPWASGARQALLLRIFDEGLGIFNGPNSAAQLVFDALPFNDEPDPESLVSLAKQKSEARLAELGRGRDRLVELNSHRPEISRPLIEAIAEVDRSTALENYLESSFNLFGLESEPLGESIHVVRPTAGMARHEPVSAETRGRYHYPELPDDGLTYTYNRDTALAREDVNFLTWESPLVSQALELVISNSTGNCTLIATKLPGLQAGLLLAETLHIIDCVAPAGLDAGRYLPPLVVRSLVTPALDDVADRLPFDPYLETLDLPGDAVSGILRQQEGVIRKLLVVAEESAQKKLKPLRESAQATMDSQMQGEISRLVALQAVNPNVREDEVRFLKDAAERLRTVISRARLRLDAVRIIITA